MPSLIFRHKSHIYQYKKKRDKKVNRVCEMFLNYFKPLNYLAVIMTVI